MSRTPVRAPELSSPDSHPTQTPVHKGSQRYNFITAPLHSSVIRYEDPDPAPVEIQYFHDFNVLDYASTHSISQCLHSIPEVPFAYANLLERSGWNASLESRVRDRFREMVRGAYNFHIRVRETTDLPALPRRMETVFDRQENLRYVRFVSPPGIAALPEADNGQFRMFRNNPLFVAPEVAQGRFHAAHQVDIWVLGVILYVMLVGRYPFTASNDRKLFKKMMKGDYTVPEYLSIEARDLIHRMLSPDPIMRASFDLVLRHPWLELNTSIALSLSTVGPFMTSAKRHKPYGAIANIKSLFRRSPELPTLPTPTPTPTPPRTPSPQTLSPSLSTISLGSAEHTPAASTSTIQTTSTRPTTISTSSTASTISTSIKSAFKWLLDGPNPPPAKPRKGTTRYSPYGAKPARREKDAEGSSDGMGIVIAI